MRSTPGIVGTPVRAVCRRSGLATSLTASGLDLTDHTDGGEDREVGCPHLCTIGPCNIAPGLALEFPNRYTATAAAAKSETTRAYLGNTLIRDTDDLPQNGV